MGPRVTHELSKIATLGKRCSERGITPAVVIAFGGARTGPNMIRRAGRVGARPTPPPPSTPRLRPT
ncbi:hypothetical protein A6A07_36595 [Streptomyces sp. CB03911]|nr:hypothetical protein A6A07_36595 [Streptomyces sp. CB03911]